MDIAEIKDALAERDQAITGKLDNIEKTLGEHTKMWDQREQEEADTSRPSRPGGGTGTAETREHRKLFEGWIRNPRNAEAQRKLTEFEMNAKSVSIASSADGGYAVPEEIGRDIEKMELKFSPVRSLVKVSRAGTSDIKRLIDIGGAESGWRSESGSVDETDTPQLREVVPTGGELYAYPKATNWSLEDVFFNVGNWLTESVAEAFAIQEGQAVISGNGTSKPTGMLNTPPVATADDASPKRAAAAYQFIPTADNSPAAVDADSLIDLVFTLNARYRSGASWAMSSTSAGAIRKLKDTYGQYLWANSLIAGTPPQLLGYPVVILEDMPDVGGGNLPVAFGDFMRGYELIDRSDIRVLLDQVTSPGWTKFYVRKRVYGHVSNNDAIKWLKCL